MIAAYIPAPFGPREVQMFRSSRAIRSNNTTELTPWAAQPRAGLFLSKLSRAAHVIGPTLTALTFMGASSAVAHAQGTISFSGAQTFMQTVQTFAEYAGAVICLIGLIFAGVSFMSGNIQRGVIGLFGAIFGAGVLGWGAGWISSLTGQSVG
jgi:hypothetical protein